MLGCAETGKKISRLRNQKQKNEVNLYVVNNDKIIDLSLSKIPLILLSLLRVAKRILSHVFSLDSLTNRPVHRRQDDTRHKKQLTTLSLRKMENVVAE